MVQKHKEAGQTPPPGTAISTINHPCQVRYIIPYSVRLDRIAVGN